MRRAEPKRSAALSRAKGSFVCKPCGAASGCGRHGVTLSRSTLCGWVAEAAELVNPLVDWMRRDLLRSRIVQTDDTPVTVLDDQGGTHKGRLWVYLGDRGHPHVVYDYTPTREGAGPTRFLNGFSGYLQAEAYSGYDALHASGSVLEVGCWSLLSRSRDGRRGYARICCTGLHSSAL
jgi:transposase